MVHGFAFGDEQKSWGVSYPFFVFRLFSNECRPDLFD